MQLSLLIVTSALVSFVQGSRYGLLRVGTSIAQDDEHLRVPVIRNEGDLSLPRSTRSALLDEDLSL